MLTLSKNDIALLRQVLHYLEEHYVTGATVYTDKFAMLSNPPAAESEEIGGHKFLSVTELFKEKRENENPDPFCERILAYLSGDYDRLCALGKAAGFSRQALEKIWDRTFHPTKISALKWSIVLELDHAKAMQLFETAAIRCSSCNKFDVVMEFCLKNGLYDFGTINRILYLLDLPVLNFAFI